MIEISSTSISLDHPLSLTEILSLHQFSKFYSGTIYLLDDHKLITSNHLPKLVSFILTSNNYEISIIVEGQNVRQTLAKIQAFLKPLTFRKPKTKRTSLKASF